jgi:2-C-methyl-D-erythritol 4-phosphate cytidylyltransferase
MSQRSIPVHLYVIIPAAGQGRRMGGTSGKQFLPIGGIPLLAKTLLAFSSFGRRMRDTIDLTLHGIVVTSTEAQGEVRQLCITYSIDYVEEIVIGGETRQDSVWNAILSLPALSRPPESDDIVLVHDGARCFVDYDTILRCFHGALEHGICTAAVPVKDTIKQIDSMENRRVIATPDRTSLFSVQTPQAFTYSLLCDSYSAGQKEKRSATDDTSLAEAIGHPVFLVDGSYSNIKITTKEDLLIAELLQSRQKDALP